MREKTLNCVYLVTDYESNHAMKWLYEVRCARINNYSVLLAYPKAYRKLLSLRLISH